MASGFKVSEIISAVQHEVGEVAGAGAQVYSEDRIKDKVQQCFNFIYTKYDWQHYRKWQQLSLDGSTGKVTTDAFENTRSPEDVLIIFRSGDNRPLPVLPLLSNPYLLTGTKLLYFTFLSVTDTDYEKKLLQFWPLAATDDIVIKTREYPTSFVPDTKLYMDFDLLVFGASWMLLADEGINPESADKNEKLFDARFRDIMKALSEHPIDATGTGNQIDFLNEWHSNP